mmetsp:Transcript_21752/g.70038  ORF Transcript_21752/g.70038 Transcript_21752/m.70038 type:complete len:263 (-) Transcript_21752:491-1279(-)
MQPQSRSLRGVQTATAASLHLRITAALAQQMEPSAPDQGSHARLHLRLRHATPRVLHRDAQERRCPASAARGVATCAWLCTPATAARMATVGSATVAPGSTTTAGAIGPPRAHQPRIRVLLFHRLVAPPPCCTTLHTHTRRELQRLRRVLHQHHRDPDLATDDALARVVEHVEEATTDASRIAAKTRQAGSGEIRLQTNARILQTCRCCSHCRLQRLNHIARLRPHLQAAPLDVLCVQDVVDDHLERRRGALDDAQRPRDLH